MMWFQTLKIKEKDIIKHLNLSHMHKKIYIHKHTRAQTNKAPPTHLLVIGVGDGERLIHRQNIPLRLPHIAIPVAETVAIGVENSTEFEVVIDSVRPAEVALGPHLARSRFQIGGREGQGGGAGGVEEEEEGEGGQRGGDPRLHGAWV